MISMVKIQLQIISWMLNCFVTPTRRQGWAYVKTLNNRTYNAGIVLKFCYFLSTNRGTLIVGKRETTVQYSFDSCFSKRNLRKSEFARAFTTTTRSRGPRVFSWIASNVLLHWLLKFRLSILPSFLKLLYTLHFIWCKTRKPCRHLC